MKDRSKKHAKLKSITPSRFDPSRTGGLRRSLTQEINRRFAILKGRIVKLVVDEDSFGLKPLSHDPFALNAFCRTGYEDVFEIRKPIKHFEVVNAFCPTGPGGGVDPTCSRIGSAIRTLLENEFRDCGSGVDINTHYCNDFAQQLKAKVPTVKIIRGKHHHYVEHDKMYYDAESPDGVRDPSQLQFFRRAPHLLALNAFCPTGKGGGRDPSCTRDVKGALKAVKAAPTVKMKATDAGAPREGVLQRGNLMKVPGKVDHSAETHAAKQAVMQHPAATVRSVELPISSITPTQAVVSKDSVKHFINTGDRTEFPHEQAVVVKLPDGRHVLHDGHHRYMSNKLSGVKTMKVQLWEAPVTANVFCATGAGGGVDPTCGKAKSMTPIEVEISDGQRELVQEKFARLGLPGTPEETLPRLVAALPGSTVSIKTKDGALVVNVLHAEYYCERHFIYDGDGKKHVYNSEFALVEHETRSGKGLGSDLFAKQVAACSEAGFSYIETMAVGRFGGPTNGYYTWPRLGYDMSLDTFGYSKKSVEVESEARKKFPDAESILDVMKTHEGRQWWKQNGLTLHKAIFDLTPQSRSMQILSAYMQEREKRSNSQTTRNSLSTQLGNTSTDLTDDRGVTNAAWRFNPDNDKIRAFQQWMRQQLLQTLTGKTEEDLWKLYTEQAVKKGIGRSYDDVNRSKKDRSTDQKQLDFYQGSQEDFLNSTFNRPVSVEKVQLLASRSFDEMQGMTSEMVTTLSRTLADGLVQKKGPAEIARDLVKKLDISKQRAETIARTEIVRAHAEGQLVALEALGVEEIGVAVEWSTSTDRAGNFDEKVCQLCRPLEGAVFSIAESRGMIPRHPNCRCAWLPANVGEKTAGQMRTQAKIVKAVKASRKREGKKSTWKPSKPISKTRPRSQVRNAFCPTGPGGGVDPTCSLHPPVSTEVYRKLSAEDRSRITKIERDRTALRKKIETTGGSPEDIQKEAELSREYKQLSDKARAGTDTSSAVRSISQETKKQEHGTQASHSYGVVDISKFRSSGKPLDVATATALLRDNDVDFGETKSHGMSKYESVRGVSVKIGSGTINLQYPTKLRHEAAETLVHLTHPRLHPTLIQSTWRITLTSQRNENDKYWEEQYGISDFKSAATGGDGAIVVYNIAPSLGTVAHEMGHNLAYKLWYSTQPPRTTTYGEAQQAELPISDYGSKSKSEDFAEIAKYYTIDKLYTKQSRPKKFAAFEELLNQGQAQ